MTRVEEGGAARRQQDASKVAREGRTDAVSSGIAKDSEHGGTSGLGRKGGAPTSGPAGRRVTKVGAAVSAASSALAAGGDPGRDDDFGDQAVGDVATTARRARSARGLAARRGRGADARAAEGDQPRTVGRPGAGSPGAMPSSGERARGEARPSVTNASRRTGVLGGRKAGDRSRRRPRIGAARRPLAAKGAGAGGRAATAARAVGPRALPVASAAAAPLAGILAAVLAFVLATLVVSQLVSSIFGFWENEEQKRSVQGLPPYITAEMVATALECQEEYGHPAGCTIAQIILESGVGDHLSSLATKDNNLFGIKWASSFGSCPEVEGKESWSTSEEYNGQTVQIMDYFTKFKSYSDCIRFRSRVLLQHGNYASDELIKQAISEHSSDRMAEGLIDAGYATESSYAEDLKAVMATYNLYRFDTMTAEEFEAVGLGGSDVLTAAESQLGVPYVWGGTTPGVALDCSGLTQYCYRCAGKDIPRNSEDQHAQGTVVPLSEACPGDILWKPGHVAIYAGGDTYIHAPHSGDVVRYGTGISYFVCAVRY